MSTKMFSFTFFTKLASGENSEVRMCADWGSHIFHVWLKHSEHFYASKAQFIIQIRLSNNTVAHFVFTSVDCVFLVLDLYIICAYSFTYQHFMALPWLRIASKGESIKLLTRRHKKKTKKKTKSHWTDWSVDIKTILNNKTNYSSKLRTPSHQYQYGGLGNEGGFHISSNFPSTKNDFRLSSLGWARLSTVSYKNKSHLLPDRHPWALLNGTLYSNFTFLFGALCCKVKCLVSPFRFTLIFFVD